MRIGFPVWHEGTSLGGFAWLGCGEAPEARFPEERFGGGFVRAEWERSTGLRSPVASWWTPEADPDFNPEQWHGASAQLAFLLAIADAVHGLDDGPLREVSALWATGVLDRTSVTEEPTRWVEGKLDVFLRTFEPGERAVFVCPRALRDQVEDALLELDPGDASVLDRLQFPRHRERISERGIRRRTMLFVDATEISDFLEWLTGGRCRHAPPISRLRPPDSWQDIEEVRGFVGSLGNGALSSLGQHAVLRVWPRAPHRPWSERPAAEPALAGVLVDRARTCGLLEQATLDFARDEDAICLAAAHLIDLGGEAEVVEAVAGEPAEPFGLQTRLTATLLRWSHRARARMRKRLAVAIASEETGRGAQLSSARIQRLLREAGIARIDDDRAIVQRALDRGGHLRRLLLRCRAPSEVYVELVLRILRGDATGDAGGLLADLHQRGERCTRDLPDTPEGRLVRCCLPDATRDEIEAMEPTLEAKWVALFRGVPNTAQDALCRRLARDARPSVRRRALALIGERRESVRRLR